ncbi:hypothetical protein [Streptomyces sp. NPDC059491]|uniref:hypothetical protein n=1 Tax=Streptomyces sp. NPDC059491 TaxID=3346850 RepID=UPI0036CB314A
MNAKRISAVAGAVLVAGVSLAWFAGWWPMAPGTISARQLAGVWAGGDGASVEFRADGTFCARDFPIERSPEQLITSCGEWSFSKGRSRDQGIDLDFDTPSYALIDMVKVAGEGGEGGLYVLFDIDDLSDRVELHRQR